MLLVWARALTRVPPSSLPTFPLAQVSVYPFETVGYLPAFPGVSLPLPLRVPLPSTPSLSVLLSWLECLCLHQAVTEQPLAPAEPILHSPAPPLGLLCLPSWL